MDITIRQLLQSIGHHPVVTLMAILTFDNVIAAGCHAAGWTKGETFFLQCVKFIKGIIAALPKTGIVEPEVKT